MSGLYNQYTGNGPMDNGQVVPYGARALVPVQCIFVAQGGYVPQVRRTFVANSHEDVVDELQETVNYAKRTGGQLNMIQLGKVAGEMMRPSVEIERYVDIENGWSQPRLSFYMEFEHQNIDGSVTRSCYTGFTDHAGVTWDSAIDPNMRLHITSMYQYRISQRRDGRYDQRILSSNNVVVHEKHYAANPNQFRNQFMQNAPSMGYGNMDREYLMDPSSAYLAERRIHAFMDKELDGTPVYFADGVVSSMAQGVNRNYSNPSFWLSNLVNTVQKNSALDANSAWGEDLQFGGADSIRQTNIQQELKGMNYRLDADPLFRIYNKHTTIINDATLLWSDLLEFVPMIEHDDICTIVFPDIGVHAGDVDNALAQRHTQNMDANDWSEATLEAVLATAIAQQVPNLMMSEFIKSMRFTVSNDMNAGYLDNVRYGWLFGSPDRNAWNNRTAIIFMSSVNEEMEIRRIENFKLRMETTILDAMFPDADIPFNLFVDIDVFGSYTVVVSIDGGPQQVFTTPSYIAPYVSPIITNDKQKLDALALNVVGAVNDVLR